MHTDSVHSPWLPGYINVAQTILVILIMAELFLDRPHISKILKLQKALKRMGIKEIHTISQTMFGHKHE